MNRGKREVVVSELAKHGKYTLGPSFPLVLSPLASR